MNLRQFIAWAIFPRLMMRRQEVRAMHLAAAHRQGCGRPCPHCPPPDYEPGDLIEQDVDW